MPHISGTSTVTRELSGRENQINGRSEAEPPVMLNCLGSDSNLKNDKPNSLSILDCNDGSGQLKGRSPTLEISSKLPQKRARSDDIGTSVAKVNSFDSNTEKKPRMDPNSTSTITNPSLSAMKSLSTLKVMPKPMPMKQPNSLQIRLVKIDGDNENTATRWKCDVCKTAVFDNFDEACVHEIKCKLAEERTKSTPKHCKHDDLLAPSETKLKSCLGDKRPTEEIMIQQSKPAQKLEPQQELSSAPGKGEIVDERRDTERNDDRQSTKMIESSIVKGSNEGACKLPQIRTWNIAPDEESSLLSDYNFLLTKNIEFFQYNDSRKNLLGKEHDNDQAEVKGRLGLRCIHCVCKGYHTTAATFFPSAIGSISSGFGTIGARHFGGRKCPVVSDGVLQKMILTKKLSTMQTKTNGRIGLDAYCRDFARRSSITNIVSGGICFRNEMNYKIMDSNETVSSILKTSKTNQAYQRPDVKTLQQYGKGPASKTASKHEKTTSFIPPNDTNKKQKEFDLSSFVPGSIENFWECKHCNTVPHPWRVRGSVVFSSCKPSMVLVEKHLKNCLGQTPLRIPRTAVMNTSYQDDKTTVRISWDKCQGIRKSERIKERGGPKKKNSKADIFEGVEDRPLVFKEDQTFTTDFAFFVMMQLKKCYLTKAGGSRGTCPVGYPGLACSHCAGELNDRRFFYTSADHLRNSFSHIPAHLGVCSACPDSVKKKIEDLKTIRSKQKSQLKMGYHKIFIDRVWERLHGHKKSNAHSRGDDSDYDDLETSDDDSLGSLSVDDISPSNGEEKNGPDVAYDIVGPTSSVLVDPSDRTYTSDYFYYSLLQVQPYHLTEKDVAQGRGAFEIGFPGMICKHCIDNDHGRKFFNRSADHLRNAFAHIPNHLMVCKKCPDDVKARLHAFKLARPAQEAKLKRGMHLAFMERVWSKLIMLDRSKKPTPVPSLTGPLEESRRLVMPEDQQLVTEFTFYTIQQLKPCSLEVSGNGARSTFEPGFPGLACVHCAGFPGGRKFFYRTSEILGGNYAHIPNHVMSCSKCPLEVKSTLATKKKVHAEQKAKLSRGSQRLFFERVWNRLHVRSLPCILCCPKNEIPLRTTG